MTVYSGAVTIAGGLETTTTGEGLKSTSTSEPLKKHL